MNNLNAFLVFGIKNKEFSITSGLGLLFKINENNFSDKVFRNFLRMTGEKVNGNKKYGVLKIHREFGNIDLLVESEDTKKILIFEIKLFSGESSGQLMKYYNFVEKNYSEYEKYFFYLTINGTKVQDTDARNFIKQ